MFVFQDSRSNIPSEFFHDQDFLLQEAIYYEPYVE